MTRGGRDDEVGGDGGRLRRAVRRLTADAAELDAADLKKQGHDLGATRLTDCGDRIPVTVFGTIKSVTIRPRAGTPALEAELYDGSAHVTLVWLGRRTIAGIDPGVNVRATGRITTSEDRRLIYNPRYELMPGEL